MSIKTKLLKIVLAKEIENYLNVAVKATLKATVAVVEECSDEEIKLLAKMGKRIYSSLENNPEIKAIGEEILEAMDDVEKVTNGNDRITESDLE